jgi:polar amino acid transport system substrate-binding protein
MSMSEAPRPRRHALRTVVVLCLVACASALAACGSDSGSTASTAAKPAGSTTLSVPSSALISGGKLQFCADISTPPLSYFSAGHEPVGTEIELGDELAKRLGLKAEWKNTAFAGIVPALQARNCDAILSQLFDKPERRKIVDFVDYLKSGQALLVPKGNPANVTGLDSLCGKKVAAETGTTISDLVREQSKKCKAAGNPAITLRLFLRDSDALQQLGLEQVDVYGTTTETVSFVTRKQPGKFEVAGQPFGQILCGIATRKDNRQLHDGIAKALASMQKDGSYSRILAKWNLQLDELK